MDIIDTIERLNTFGRYPFATLVHIAVGFLCGWHGVKGIHKDQTGRVLFAVAFFLFWAGGYEMAEYLTERDSPDIDIANGLAGIVLAMIVYPICEILRKD